jgi:hypothetical protein
VLLSYLLALNASARGSALERNDRLQRKVGTKQLSGSASGVETAAGTISTSWARRGNRQPREQFGAHKVEIVQSITDSGSSG